MLNLASMQRILVVTKFRYLGDTIVATPFLRRLKEAAPDADITLLTGPALPKLLQGCPYLAEILPFDPKAPARFRRNRQLIARLRQTAFDAAFLLNRSLHSALVAWAARIPGRIGFDTEYRGPLLTHRVPYRGDRPERDCLMDLLRAVDIESDSDLPELWVSEAEQEEARRMLAARCIPTDALLVGMQPGANDPAVREWGADRFAEVGDRLVRECGARLVLLGSKEERAVSEQVGRALAQKGASAHVILTGETDLRQALSIISLCRLWIGNDAGLLHAAVALGPATVGLFGPTKAPRWGYATQRHRTMVVMPNPPANDPQTIRRCLDAITPQSVYQAAMDVLKTEV